MGRRNRQIPSRCLCEFIQTLNLRKARSSHNIANNRLSRNRRRLCRGLSVPLHLALLLRRFLRQHFRASHVASHTSTQILADDSLHHMIARVVQRELRRRQRVRRQILRLTRSLLPHIQQESNLAFITRGHQLRGLLQLLRLPQNPISNVLGEHIPWCPIAASSATIHFEFRFQPAQDSHSEASGFAPGCSRPSAIRSVGRGVAAYPGRDPERSRTSESTVACPACYA